MKQKDTLIQLEELSKRVGLMIKQYNDLARSESLDTRLIYGNVYPYVDDDKANPKAIYDFGNKDDENTEDSWSSSNCEWQSSSDNC